MHIRNLEVILLNMAGHRMHAGEWSMAGKENTYTMATSALVPGVYYIQLHHAESGAMEIVPVIVAQ